MRSRVALGESIRRDETSGVSHRSPQEPLWLGSGRSPSLSWSFNSLQEISLSNVAATIAVFPIQSRSGWETPGAKAGPRTSRSMERYTGPSNSTGLFRSQIRTSINFDPEAFRLLQLVRCHRWDADLKQAPDPRWSLGRAPPVGGVRVRGSTQNGDVTRIEFLDGHRPGSIPARAGSQSPALPRSSNLSA